MSKTFILNGTFKTIHVDDDEDLIKIEGYASTKDVDRDGDIILPDAWTVNGGLDNYKMNPIILFNHMHSKPIGKAIEITVDGKGLKITAQIAKVAGDIFDIIKSGILQTFSVGFRIKDAEFKEETMGFLITDAELFEVSVVSVPANQAAIFSVSKSFKDKEDYLEFKRKFNINESVDLTSQSLTSEKLDSDTPQAISKKVSTEKSMEEKDLEVFAKELAATLAKENADARAKERADDAVKAATEKARKEATEKAAAEKKEELAILASVVNSGAEQLIKDLEERHLEKQESLVELVAELKTTIEEKAEEMNKIHASKRFFDDASSNKDWKKEFGNQIDDAYILGFCVNKSWEDTDMGKNVMKAVNDWSGVEVSSDNYEQLVSTNVERDIQLQLVLAPMFREVAMTSASMIFPVFPDAGYAEWSAVQNPGGISGAHGSLNERGDTYGSPYGGHNLIERTVSTKKLISKSFLANETEEDAIMPVLPLIRESMVRSHARAMENMILAGNHTDGAFGTGGSSPNGLIQIADAAALQTDAGTSGYAASDKITAANLLTVRRNMGKYAVNPSDIVYLVSLDVYYDLLEDPEFQDVNLVGDMATKIKGQIGSIFGSRVVICDEFATKAAAKFAVVGVNTRNYFVPRLRGFTIESDYEVLNQRRVLVVSQRIGFSDVIESSTTVASVWGYQYKLTA